MELNKIRIEFEKCRKDPVYFICNYIKVVHPIFGLVKFDLYEFQKILLPSLKLIDLIYYVNLDKLAVLR